VKACRPGGAGIGGAGGRRQQGLVEAGQRGCVPEAALCAGLVSGRDLLIRIGRDVGHLQDRRDAFEDGGTSDFHTLLRAQQFARDHGFSAPSGAPADRRRTRADPHLDPGPKWQASRIDAGLARVAESGIPETPGGAEVEAPGVSLAVTLGAVFGWGVSRLDRDGGFPP
jgi:hypothetical protein